MGIWHLVGWYLGNKVSGESRVVLKRVDKSRKFPQNYKTAQRHTTK